MATSWTLNNRDPIWGSNLTRLQAHRELSIGELVHFQEENQIELFLESFHLDRAQAYPDHKTPGTLSRK